MPSVYAGLVSPRVQAECLPCAARARAHLAKLRQQTGVGAAPHRRREYAGQASGGFNINTVLSPVLTSFGIDDGDLSKLPAAVAEKYNEVATQLTNVPGMSMEQLGAAFGPSVVNSIADFASNNPGAGAMALYNAMLGTMAMAGGPIGAAMASGLAGIQAVFDAIGGTAQGGSGGQCCDQSVGWYGGWPIYQKKPPLSPSSAGGSAWIAWDQQTTKTGYASPMMSDGSYSICGDDLPTATAPFDMSKVPSGISVTQVNNDYGDCGDSCVQSCMGLPGTLVSNPVTGGFAWLPYVVYGFNKNDFDPFDPYTPGTASSAGSTIPYSSDSFDFALAQMIVHLLDQYVNAAGPSPTLDYPAGNGTNLRDVLENMLVGWNAIHEPGTPVWINDPSRMITIPGGTFGGQQQPSTQGLPSYLVYQRADPGDLAAFIEFSDPRQQGPKLMMNTGPLLQSIQDLFAMAPGGAGLLISGDASSSSTPAPVTAAQIAAAAAASSNVNLSQLLAEAQAASKPPLDTAIMNAIHGAARLNSDDAGTPPPPPPASPGWGGAIGLSTITTVGVALAFGMPLTALGVLGVGAMAGYVQALRSL